MRAKASDSPTSCAPKGARAGPPSGQSLDSHPIRFHAASPARSAVDRTGRAGRAGRSRAAWNGFGWAGEARQEHTGRERMAELPHSVAGQIANQGAALSEPQPAGLRSLAKWNPNKPREFESATNPKSKTLGICRYAALFLRPQRGWLVFSRRLPDRMCLG